MADDFTLSEEEKQVILKWRENQDKVIFIPLDKAVVCLDCHAVSNSTIDKCPACPGSAGLERLSKLLNLDNEAKKL